MKLGTVLVIGFSTSLGFSNPTYHIQRMPIDPITNTRFAGHVINNLGHVAGNADPLDWSFSNPCIWNASNELIRFSPPSGFAGPSALNDLNEVAGFTNDANELPGSGFRWDAIHGYRELPARYQNTNLWQDVYGINSSGSIIGEVYTGRLNGQSYPVKGVYWDANNIVHDLPHQENGGLLIPFDINDAGRIVGWNFYLDPDGSIHTFSGVNIEHDRIAHSVNASGQMLGIGYGNSGNKIYIWNADGSVLYHFDSTNSFTIGDDGEDLNDLTEAVMTFQTHPDNVNHGMYFSPATGLLALDSLLDSESLAAGWHIRSTYSINNRGQIVAFASTGNTMESNYTGESVLLQPVPEPVSLAVLAVGAVGLLRRRRK